MRRRHALKLREGLLAVAEWETEHGALTPEELDAARRRIDIGEPQQRPA